MYKRQTSIRLPDVRLLIVGKDPPAVLRRMAERHPRLVTVTGTVPDVRPYLRRAAAAAIPLVYGAGSQFKVLEAMACGTPVVASPQAASALSARPGRDLLVAAEPQAFAQAVVDLLEAPRRQREIGRAGRLYVEGGHRWDRIAAGLEIVYEDLLEERRAPGRRRARDGRTRGLGARGAAGVQARVH